MPKHGSKLQRALDRHQGRDIKKELQKRHMKQVEKQKQTHRTEEVLAQAGESEDEQDFDDVEDSDSEEGGIDISRLNESESDSADDDEGETKMQSVGLKNRKSARSNGNVNGKSSSERLLEDNEEEEEEEATDEDEDEDIPLSDLEELQGDDGEDQDIIPHQRLTINNTSALQRALASIALPLSLPFSENMATTGETETAIPDIDDDLNRETSFYAQSLEAARLGRAHLRREGVAFTRPVDYFAEMVKSDEHMGKVKSKLVEEASNKKAAQEARQQRDLKKFGKQVQQEKLKERAKQKKEMLEKVGALKRKRQSSGLDTAHEEDIFDVALEDAAVTEKKDREERKRKGQAASKRKQKDQKYGFGGKKRHAKSGDAISSADMRGFSAKKMKAGAKASARRPGKAKRRKLNT